MSTKILVGGLTRKAAESDLRDLFTKYGDVEHVSIVKEGFALKAKTYAYITMTSAESSQKAMTDMNGKDMNGRRLSVSQAFGQSKR